MRTGRRRRPATPRGPRPTVRRVRIPVDRAGSGGVDAENDVGSARRNRHPCRRPRQTTSPRPPPTQHPGPRAVPRMKQHRPRRRPPAEWTRRRPNRRRSGRQTPQTEATERNEPRGNADPATGNGVDAAATATTQRVPPPPETPRRRLRTRRPLRSPAPRRTRGPRRTPAPRRTPGPGRTRRIEFAVTASRLASCAVSRVPHPVAIVAD